MAIPGIPQNFIVAQANRQVALSWDNAPGATSYNIQRSLDNVTFADYDTSTTASYLDTAVTVGVQYWYQVAGVSGSGTGIYTQSAWAIPAPTAELSLKELRLRSEQKADFINSNFVTQDEWNFFINQSMYELYDLLITAYEDYFMAPAAQFTTNSVDFLYPLPDGALPFKDLSGNTFIAKPFYKLAGIDLGIQTAANAFVTVNKFNFADRNNYVYPNSASTIYGVFNMRYRLIGTNIEFIPTPTSGQPIRLWYYPRLPALLQDTDTTTLGVSGWLQYVIVRAAKYALDKEESDTSKLDQELIFLKGRIEESAQGRDASQPDRVSDTRKNSGYGWNGFGFNGPVGGW